MQRTHAMRAGLAAAAAGLLALAAPSALAAPATTSDDLLNAADNTDDWLTTHRT